MKKVFNAFIDRLSKETGYGYDYLVDRYNEAMDAGVSAVDFADEVFDSSIYI